MVAAEGDGFFHANNTACSKYFPIFQVKRKVSVILLLLSSVDTSKANSIVHTLGYTLTILLFLFLFVK